MTDRDRTRLIVAMAVVPLIVAVPALWPKLGQPGFLRRNLDIVLIFLALPYATALWLYAAKRRRR